MGLDNLVFEIYDRPAFIRDLLALVAALNRRRMEVVLDAGVDLYIKRAWYDAIFGPPAPKNNADLVLFTSNTINPDIPLENIYAMYEAIGE